MVGFLLSFSRETPVLKQLKRSEMNSVPLPVLITFSKAPPNAASTNCTTMAATVSQLTVTWSPSPARPGPWLCHGVIRIASFLLFWKPRLSKTLQWTRTPRTGICTAWAWHEWGLYRITPPTGEQHAATRLMASISLTTSGEALRISTSSTSLVMLSARKWNTSTSADTWASIRRWLSGRLLTLTCCILTVLTLIVSSSQSLVRCQVKTTLDTTGASTPGSAAPREAIPPHSGGSELISDLFSQRYNSMLLHGLVTALHQWTPDLI